MTEAYSAPKSVTAPKKTPPSSTHSSTGSQPNAEMCIRDRHYLGSAGLFILAATVTLACLKTAVGLITSCAETFSALFPDCLLYTSDLDYICYRVGSNLAKTVIKRGEIV